jgi:hypothetical protein
MSETLREIASGLSNRTTAFILTRFVKRGIERAGFGY